MSGVCAPLAASIAQERALLAHPDSLVPKRPRYFVDVGSKYGVPEPRCVLATLKTLLALVYFHVVPRKIVAGTAVVGGL